MDNGATTFRAARVDDAGEIARLATELGYFTEPGDMETRLAGLLDDARHHVVVAGGATGHLLGWAHAEQRLSVESGARAELVGLVVDAAARRRGIGNALVELVEAWARERGLRTIVVRSNVVRPVSHSFYPALGYRSEKTQHVYVKPL